MAVLAHLVQDDDGRALGESVDSGVSRQGGRARQQHEPVVRIVPVEIGRAERATRRGLLTNLKSQDLGGFVVRPSAVDRDLHVQDVTEPQLLCQPCSNT